MVGTFDLFEFPTTCPGCGAHDPQLESLEVANAYIPIEPYADGTLQFGVAVVDWSSMVSTEYRWACCSEPLTEQQSFIVDRLLGNDRSEVTFKTIFEKV